MFQDGFTCSGKACSKYKGSVFFVMKVNNPSAEIMLAIQSATAGSEEVSRGMQFGEKVAFHHTDV